MYTFMGLTVIRQFSMYDNGILNTIKLKNFSVKGLIGFIITIIFQL